MAGCIAVVDYQKGNLKSVERGLAAVGGDAFVTADPSAIARADAIVLPGVGAFADAAATMCALGQMDVIRQRLASGVPFLGICLGLHLMFEEGVEGASREDDETSTNNARGLAILPGVVTKLPSRDEQGLLYKVPHVGWNTVSPAYKERPEDAQSLEQSCSHEASTGCFGSCGTRLADTSESLLSDADVFRCPLFKGIAPDAYFYFTHSYVAPSGPFAVAETSHSVLFPSAVQYGDAAFGVQFHPEKSSDAGATVLRNFVNLVKGA